MYLFDGSHPNQIRTKPWISPDNPPKQLGFVEFGDGVFLMGITSHGMKITTDPIDLHFLHDFFRATADPDVLDLLNGKVIFNGDYIPWDENHHEKLIIW